MKKIHIVPHTHWDREWYKPYGFFRTKSVFVIDQAIEALEAYPGFRHFMLDGQTSIVEDYLRIRPSMEDRLKKLVSSGSLAVGPWYIQPDEFAPDGESLVRNLQIGIAQARRLGRCMMVGYIPDSFGHSSQMPQILKGFGIETAVVMRGVDAETLGCSEFRWESVSKDSVLTVYLVQGYSNAMFLSEKKEINQQRMKRLEGELSEWTRSDTVLAMNGVDHAFAQEQTADLASGDEGITLGSLEEYLENLGLEAASLPELRGELITPVHHRVHTSIASTRMRQKIENRLSSAFLARSLEPLCAQAWIEGISYPSDIIEDAWKLLLLNQTHDGIGGCCTDEVHREMDQRFVSLRQTGLTLAKNYSRAIAAGVPNDGFHITVFNTSLRAGKVIVRANVFFNEPFRLLDAEGEEVPYQILEKQNIDVTRMSIWTLYLCDPQPTPQTIILFECDFEAAWARRSFRIVPGRPARIEWPEDDICDVTINKDGSVDITDTVSGETYYGLNVYEDVGDCGDSYNFCPLEHGQRILSTSYPADIRCVEQGPIRMRYEIRQNIALPASLDKKSGGRSEHFVKGTVITSIYQYRNSPLVGFSVDIDNKALDHRLRALFPLNDSVEESFAETQFGIVHRPTGMPSYGKEWPEVPLPIYSMQRFCGLDSGARKLAVLNRGLTEYEVYQDGEDSTLAVTLHRGVGMMGRDNLSIRPGRPSGLLMPVPDAQGKGRFRRDYAVLVGEAANVSGLSAWADRYDSEILAVQNRLDWGKPTEGNEIFFQVMSIENLQSSLSKSLEKECEGDRNFLSLRDGSLSITSIKKARVGESLAIRMYNPGPEPVQERLHLNFSHGTVAVTDLMEENPWELTGTDGYDLPELAAGKILTLRIDKEVP